MTTGIDLPLDDASDADIAADYLELVAVFRGEGQASRADISNTVDIEIEREYDDVDERGGGEEVANAALRRIKSRIDALGEAYPFELDFAMGVLSLDVEKLDVARTAYLLSLLLANLRPVSPLLQDFPRYPSPERERYLRQSFQYFATAAIAGEVGGSSWSFGFPRPDGSGFVSKLREIWSTLKDGTVGPHESAPSQPKDDGVDVLAWRETRDGLPGFLLVAAQVATGRDWKSKSIKGRLDAFRDRWFRDAPASRLIPYHVIPFARPDDKFRDDVLVVGNLLHRLRVPRRVADAAALVENERISVEAFEKLDEAVLRIRNCIEEVRAA